MQNVIFLGNSWSTK